MYYIKYDGSLFIKLRLKRVENGKKREKKLTDIITLGILRGI